MKAVAKKSWAPGARATISSIAVPSPEFSAEAALPRQDGNFRKISGSLDLVEEINAVRKDANLDARSIDAEEVTGFVSTVSDIACRVYGAWVIPGCALGVMPPLPARASRGPS